MMYRVLKRMIERGQVTDLENKLDVFFATGKLTEDEYSELQDMLSHAAKTGV